MSSVTSNNGFSKQSGAQGISAWTVTATVSFVAAAAFATCYAGGSFGVWGNFLPEGLYVSMGCVGLGVTSFILKSYFSPSKSGSSEESILPDFFRGKEGLNGLTYQKFLRASDDQLRQNSSWETQCFPIYGKNQLKEICLTDQIRDDLKQLLSSGAPRERVLAGYQRLLRLWGLEKNVGEKEGKDYSKFVEDKRVKARVSRAIQFLLLMGFEEEGETLAERAIEASKSLESSEGEWREARKIWNHLKEARWVGVLKENDNWRHSHTYSEYSHTIGAS